MIHTKRANRKNAGISTIIAAALLVAMTVIAAVALGSTVLQVPTNAEKPYQLQMSGWASKSTNEIRLTHLGGDPINTGTITIKTLIPNGGYEDIVHTVSNTLSGSYIKTMNAFWYAVDIEGVPTGYERPALSMWLQNDPFTCAMSFPVIPGYGFDMDGDGVADSGTIEKYPPNKYLEYSSATYKAPVQAGDTLVLNFDKSFGTGMYGKAEPKVGEQFVVQLFSGSQPVTAVTIVLQP